MDQTRQMMRNALSGIGFGAAAVSTFDDDTLDKLCAADFHLPGRLQSATRADLKDARVAPGDVGFIMSKVQGVAAGLGPGSMAAAAAGEVLVTHHHGGHASWRKGETHEVLVNASSMAGRQQKAMQRAKVLAIHPEMDVIVLLTVREALL